METTTFVAGAATHVGNVREHNEDAHLVDVDRGLFAVCDGMGGHAAGEVASGIAVSVVRERWGGADLRAAVDAWARQGTPEARRALIDVLRASVLDAHAKIVEEAGKDVGKRGMGTTFVGMMIAGGDAVFAQAGDSRAYLVRDGVAMQLTEDHTLLARLAAAGIDVSGQGEESRWKGVLTNALGIGDRTTVSTFVVPLEPGDRFLLCSDGVTEYVKEEEVGVVLTTQAPGRAAQKLIELALERGGADNATAVIVKVLEVTPTRVPAEKKTRDATVLAESAFLARLSPPQRLRAVKFASERELPADERIPAAALGDRVAWLILDGHAHRDGVLLGPGELVYPESLLPNRPPIEKEGLASPAGGPVRALAFRRDDFVEITADDPELAEPLFAALARILGAE